jgi:hypothetical protein
VVIIRHLVNSTRYRGRSLSVELGFLGLPEGARLEPSRLLPDVYNLEICALPIELTFWVGSPDGRVLHDSPLFMVPGVTINSWCVDLLHAWVLGPLAKMIGLAIHLFLATGIFAPSSQYLQAEHRHKLSMLHIKTKLKEYYARNHRQDPDWIKKHSEV